MAVTHIICCYYLVVFFIYFTVKFYYEDFEFSVKKCFLMWNLLKKYKIAFLQ